MLDVNKLYKDGFDTFILDKIYVKRLWNLVKKEEWVDVDQSDGNTIKSMPKWMESIDEDDYKSPKKYKRLFEDLILEKQYNGNLNSYYDLKVNEVQMWDGVEEEDNYHWDGNVNGDMFMLIYLSDFDEWDGKYGGGISCGVRDLINGKDWIDSNLDQEYIKVKEEEKTFYPDNGRIVFGNNLNPRQVHRPIPLTKEAKELGIKRITLLVTINLEIK